MSWLAATSLTKRGNHFFTPAKLQHSAHVSGRYFAALPGLPPPHRRQQASPIKRRFYIRHMQYRRRWAAGLGFGLNGLIFAAAGTPAPADTLRVLALDEQCWALMATDLPTARRAGLAGLALARRIGYVRGQAKCLNDLGNAATYAADLPAATAYYQQALPLFEQLGYRRGRCFALTGLGNVAYQQQDFHASARWHRQALHLARRPTPLAPADRALVLGNLGNALVSLDSLATAQAVLAEALALHRRYPEAAGCPAHVLVNLGLVARNQGRYAAAEALLREAIAAAHQAGLAYPEGAGLLNLGEVALATGRPATALALAERSLALARRTGTTEQAASSARLAQDAAERLGRLRPALAYARQAAALRDSVLSTDKAQALARLETQFQARQQRQRIRLLTTRDALRQAQLARQRQATRWAVGLSAGLALGLGLFAWFYRRLRRSRAALARSETALRAANRTKDQLMSLVGHDLRTPLAAFQMVGPVLLDLAVQPTPGPELRALATELHESAREMAALLDNVLDWARAQTGQVLLRPAPLAPAEAAAAALALLRPAASAKNIRLELLAPPALPPLRTDAAVLATILRNLLANAVKFTPPGGRVWLRLEPTAAGLGLWVEDQGPGLPPGALSATPPPPGTGTAGEVGTGLGLPLCQVFARLLGGGLRAEAAPGGGARVGLVLGLS